MCEVSRYALAEIYLNNRDNSKEVYCLCSRVFLRSKDDNYKRSVFTNEFSASEEELLIDEELSSECNSLPTTFKHKLKQDIEPETVSCYCSASHTDNLSTDEHDSLRDSHEPRLLKGLQSSDSGADLTECIRQDIDSEWQKFWSHSGERLIWDSWIAKYSAYINPEYLQYAQQDQEAETFLLEKKPFLTLDIQPSYVLNKEDDEKKRELDRKNRILVRNLSGSDDKLNTDVSEGWNPLSPSSVDGETEVEQLLSSKCGSHVSSIRTVDSMTNVTRLTISSLDFSESPHSSESFSSVSSVPSSLSSTSSEENEEDYQHQWHVLWKEHYQGEFFRQYQIFVTSRKDHNISDLGLAEKIEENSNVSLKNPSHTSYQKKKNIHKVFQGKIKKEIKCPIEVNRNLVQSLGFMLSGLSVSREQNIKMSDNRNKSDEFKQMEAMGLPTAFKSKEKIEEAQEGAETIDFSDFESARKKIKAAFNLIGIEFHDSNQNSYSGRVQYKTKHIRLQNRHLKIRNSYSVKHLHFDEGGNVIPDESFLSILPDSSDDKHSSADETVNSDTLTPKLEEQLDDSFAPKRRKRKRKLGGNKPQEIKGNSDLSRYWHKRFILFSKFDEGIKLDPESWYSVTPEQIAIHTAQRCKCDIIVDGFCGAGGNSIQFAFTCKKVIAIDIDPNKIELARNNARIYGVADRIEFIVGDFFQLARTIIADVLFLSPPWGGPSYLHTDVYDLESMLQPVSISKLLCTGRAITNNIAVFLPRNSNAFLLIDETKPGGGVEIEQNFIRKKLVAITAYYGDLIKKT